jgi:hypothetical protein
MDGIMLIKFHLCVLLCVAKIYLGRQLAAGYIIVVVQKEEYVANTRD